MSAAYGIGYDAPAVTTSPSAVEMASWEASSTMMSTSVAIGPFWLCVTAKLTLQKRAGKGVVILGRRGFRHPHKRAGKSAAILGRGRFLHRVLRRSAIT